MAERLMKESKGHVKGYTNKDGKTGNGEQFWREKSIYEFGAKV